MPSLGGIRTCVERILIWITFSVLLSETAPLAPENGGEPTPATESLDGTEDAKPKLVRDYAYDYRENGPRTWPFKFGSCAGKHQSPIDLDTTRSLPRYLPRLHWWNYNKRPRKMTLTNDGHSAVLKGKWNERDCVPSFWLSSENGEAKTYVFEQLHFHWGSNSSIGSEHAINSVVYPLEMHVVHRRKDFCSLAEALAAGKDGVVVVVVAVLFKVSERDNEGLAPITSALKRVASFGKEVAIEPFGLGTVLPEFSDSFLAYNGSLTTPPCTEAVSWVVKLEISTVSKKQLNEFRSLRTENNERLLNNFRPLQPVNGRSVWHVR